MPKTEYCELKAERGKLGAGSTGLAVLRADELRAKSLELGAGRDRVRVRAELS